MEPVNACVEDLIEPGYQIIPYGMIDSHVKDMSYMKHFSYSAVAIRLVLVGFLCKTQNKNENELTHQISKTNGLNQYDIRS